MTVDDHDALVRELLETDPDFRRLHDEHRQCEHRLEELRYKSLLSQEDEIEEKKLKVHKLALKDRMEYMVREHEGMRATA
ncbi:MAG TPA: hypothetical protein VJG13_04455 [Thermoanaerobaculia bacterium]|jgi:uncharacterized protein YdcH (DUF465 family)|nr:hypothetical protein [Thermoanaerobaculia bacterium]